MSKAFFTGLVGLVLTVPSGVNATTNRATVQKPVNLREQPNTTSSVKRTLPAGEELEVLSSKTTGGFHSVKTNRGEQGFVWAPNVSVQGEKEAMQPSTTRAAFAKGPCANSLDDCTPDGCEPADTPHALLNNFKRRTTDLHGNKITFASATPITISDMIDLQASAENVLPPPKPFQDLTAAQRDLLKNMSVRGISLGEGTAVRVTGFIAPPVQGTPSAGAHEGGPESVNCRVPKPPDAPSWTVHDFHIPITNDPITPGDDVSECDGVVVEMIPQDRDQHPNWVLTNLKRVARNRQLAMFVGPLFYDNEHVPNPDCENLVSSQPKRATVWEVHPVIEFYVCDTGNSCKTTSLAGWTRID